MISREGMARLSGGRIGCLCVGVTALDELHRAQSSGLPLCDADRARPQLQQMRQRTKPGPVAVVDQYNRSSRGRSRGASMLARLIPVQRARAKWSSARLRTERSWQPLDATRARM